MPFFCVPIRSYNCEYLAPVVMVTGAVTFEILNLSGACREDVVNLSGEDESRIGEYPR